MTKKQFIGIIAFALVVALLVFGLNELVLTQPSIALAEKRFNDYKELEEGTVDVIFTGTSGIDRYWIAAKAFEDYGITAYPLSSDAQSSWLTKIVLQEATLYQNPELVIIDMRCFTSQYGKKITSIEAGSRYLIDGKALSFDNKVEAINRTVTSLSTLAPEKNWDKKTFYFPLLKHHGVWANINNLAHEDSLSILGFYMCPIRSIKKTEGFEDVTSTVTEIGSMHPIAEESLYELLDYLEEQPYEVLFLNTPQGRSEYEMTTLNALCKILDDRGYKYLIYDLTESGYDMIEDFYHESHVNYYGAEMFTAEFSQYLIENYNLTDHRGDDKYNGWYGYYDEIKANIAEWELAQPTEETQTVEIDNQVIYDYN